MTDDTTDRQDSADADEDGPNGGVPSDMADGVGFLEDRAPGEYPSRLRLTAQPESTHRQNALDRLARWDAGEEVPHVVNFQDPSDLRALLTDRRLELLRSIMDERPDSIRALAGRLDRDVKSIHDDLQVLGEYDIVHFEQNGRAKQPFVPYDTIEITLEISKPGGADDVAPA